MRNLLACDHARCAFSTAIMLSTDRHVAVSAFLFRPVNTRFLSLLGIVLCVAVGRGETGTTNIIEAAYINQGGQYVLGETGPFNVLLVRNEGWLENTSGIIGYEPGADSNLAWVTGANSLWDNRNALRIGVFGRENSVTITNGGRVNAMPGVLGEEESSYGNSVLVTGAGSRWNSSALQVGLSGYSNRFIVVQGAFATSGGLFDAIGYNEPSYGNIMEVDGAGSTFSGFNLAVGSYGSQGNQLRVSNGGQLYTTSGFVGNGSNNSVLISGPGSIWHNSAVLFHGNDGAGNRGEIANGGRLVSTGVLVSGTNNTFLVVGTNSLWETGGEDGQLDIGYPGVSNSVTIAGGGRVNSWNGYVVGDYSLFNIHSPGSLWQNTEMITVGEDFGVGNQLIISNRARVQTADLTLAGDFGALRVSGAGAVLDITDSINIGDEEGEGNLFVIADGAQVNNAHGYLAGSPTGFFMGGNNDNRALVGGAGSFWNNRSNLTVGLTGSATELGIRGGGRVANRTGYLGYYGFSVNNRVVVSDPGSVWENSGDVYVGYGSDENTLVITNAGRVQSGNGWIGRPFCDKNSVLIHGPNAGWTVTGGLLVGNGGSANRVTIAGGANLFSDTGAIDSPNGRSNSIVVSGPGSAWTVNSSVTIGGSSSLNHLHIEDEGSVFAGGLTLGNAGSSISNTLVLNNGRLVVTNSTRTAALTINEGALFLSLADLTVDRLQMMSGPLSLISFGSGLANVRTLTVSGSSAAQVGSGSGTARLHLGATTHALGNLTVAPNSVLALAGTATGTITNAGLLEIGTNVAGPSLTGNLVQSPGSAMAFDLGGAVQRTGYDFLQLDGPVQLDGQLRLRLINGFVPSSNSSFTLISARAITGSFVNAPSGSRLTFENTATSCQVEYSGGTLRLSHFQNARPSATNEIDEAWALRYFGHSPLTDAEKQADADGDGLSNYQEFLAGTDPLEAGSTLKILAVRKSLAGQPVIEFASVTNKNYTVAFSTNGENWQEVAAPAFDVVAPGVLQWIDDGLQTGGLVLTPRFYRVTAR